MTPSTRKFYRTVITVEVLSEEPLDPTVSLADVESAITDGDCSGDVKFTASETLTGPQTADALMKQGSDPEFFRLTENGEDV